MDRHGRLPPPVHGADGVTAIDAAFEGARAGMPEAFAKWMTLVERSLRGSLRRFARAVDVEVVMQETFLRMWIAATDPEREWVGNDASLRFAFRVARNVAFEEARRTGHGHLVPLPEPGDGAEPAIDPPPPSDPGLLRAIRTCLGRLTGKPREVLFARLRDGHRTADRDLAASLQMTANTFLQNVVRARRAVAQCLEGKGVRLQEVLR